MTMLKTTKRGTVARYEYLEIAHGIDLNEKPCGRWTQDVHIRHNSSESTWLSAGTPFYAVKSVI